MNRALGMNKGYVEVFFVDMNSVTGRNPPHPGTTWSGATTEEQMMRQEVPTGLIARRSDVPYRPRAEGTVQ
ncbi:hypothetical protein TNCV_3365021 [Trichonephila clavipes]|nr:hypothetical protein TNCV_3365021 [Trichonephila clavipes]